MKSKSKRDRERERAKKSLVKIKQSFELYMTYFFAGMCS